MTMVCCCDFNKVEDVSVLAHPQFVETALAC